MVLGSQFVVAQLPDLKGLAGEDHVQSSSVYSGPDHGSLWIFMDNVG